MKDLTLFNYNDSQVRTIKDENNCIWWVTKDVCNILGISKYRDALSRLDNDERGSVILDTLGGEQEFSTVNESGLYALIFKSRKQEAKKFSQASLTDMLQEAIDEGIKVKLLPANTGWMEIHEFDDYKFACEKVKT